jgi:hypothetical protein
VRCGYPDEQNRDEQQTGCRIRAVRMGKQKEQKAEEDCHHCNTVQSSSIPVLAHGRSAGGASIADFLPGIASCTGSASRDRSLDAFRIPNKRDCWAAPPRRRFAEDNVGAAPMALPRQGRGGRDHDGDSTPALPGWADVQLCPRLHSLAGGPPGLDGI